MPTSLRTRTLGALSWSLIQELSQRGLQFVIGIALARALAPAAFGLVAMLSVFIAVAQAILDSGFGSALIQKKEPTEVEKCSVFYFNLLLSLVLTGAFCLAAPGVAAFYKQPQLTNLARALSLILVINGLVVVQNALLTRQLDFKRQTVITILSTAVSGALGLGFAFYGFGVWSLVIQQLSGSLTRTALYWGLNLWRPRWLFSFGALRKLFVFGSGMLASSVVNTVFDNLYPLIIGKIFSATTLGFYSRAQTLQGIPGQSLGMVAARVTFPVFSNLQDDRARLRNGLHKAITTIVFLHFPMMIGLVAVAKPLVLFLFTEKWAPCIPYFQLLCFVGLWFPLQVLNLNVLLAVGRSGLFFRLEIIKKVLVLFTIAVTFRLGIEAMIWGQILCSFLSFFVNSYYSMRFVAYSTWQQLRDVSPYLVAAGFMGLITAIINPTLPFGHAGQLGFKIVLGLFVYLSLAIGLRFPALGELREIARSKRFGVASPVPVSSTVGDSGLASATERKVEVVRDA